MVGYNQKGERKAKNQTQKPVVWRVDNVSVKWAMLPPWNKLLELATDSEVVHFVDILEKVSLEEGSWRR